ncbi:MAG: hypothetical protein ABI471_01480 [Sphingomonas bacterium]
MSARDEVLIGLSGSVEIDILSGCPYETVARDVVSPLDKGLPRPCGGAPISRLNAIEFVVRHLDMAPSGCSIRLVSETNA